jgi:hypothetical protein
MESLVIDGGAKGGRMSYAAATRLSPPAAGATGGTSAPWNPPTSRGHRFICYPLGPEVNGLHLVLLTRFDHSAVVVPRRLPGYRVGMLGFENPDDGLAAIARDLLDQSTPAATVERIVDLAVEVLPGCDHAGISLVKRRRISTVAATDDVAREGDQHQYALDEGPCLDTVHREETVRSTRLANDQRWPSWAPWASSHLGVDSMLCLQLFTTEHSYGALNLYSDQLAGFDARDEEAGLALAAQAAVAIASSEQIATLNTALGTRTVIGRAEGILMERYRLTADQAFAALVRLSQGRNQRLVQIAEELVTSRKLPDDASTETKPVGTVKP